MALQDRLAGIPVLGVGLAVQRRYVSDAADPLAAAIAFFGFLSLFPLLLLAVSVAGFVLTDPDDQIAVAVALTEMIPGFDTTLGLSGADEGVTAFIEGIVARRGTIGVVGGVALVFSGLKVITAAMAATRVVFRGEVVFGVRARLLQLVALVLLGAVALLAVAGSSLAAPELGLLPAALSLGLSLLITFLLDLGLFFAAYTWLSPTSTLSPRQLLPGALLAAGGWSLLKVVSSRLLGTQLGGGNALYGALAGVVALLLLLYLAGRLYLYGAELSAVLVERRSGPLGASVTHGNTEAAAVTPPARRQDGLEVTGPPPVPAIARIPRPQDPGPSAPSPTVGAGTQGRLAAAEDDRLVAAAGRDRGGDARTMVAYGLAAAALAMAWRFLGSGRQ